MPKEYLKTKYLYCPECKCYPDEIYEKNICWTSRKWHKDCYRGYETEYDDEKSISYCQKCDTILIKK